MNTSLSPESVLDFLKHRAARPLKPKEIARGLGVEARHYRQLLLLLRKMEAEGRIYRVKKGRYALPERINLLVGRVQTTRAGDGFVIPEGGGADIFVPGSRLGSAYHDDRVVVRIERTRRGRNPEGTVVKILERAHEQVVGAYHRGGRYGFVVPEEPRLRRDVFIPPGADKRAKDGDVVVVRIVDWGDAMLNPVGEVAEVLGHPDAPGVDVLSIVYGHGLPVEFSPEVGREAARIHKRGISRPDLEGREDLRRLLVFTIDPADAKDHDDALSVERLGSSTFRVGIHIADVSHYVPERSDLDLEAFRRGTSVYLVDRVLPMLPPELSGDLCSLRPDEDRLAVTLLLDMDREGRVHGHRLVRSVIRSRHRLSYEEAQAILDGAQEAPAALRDALRVLWALSVKLRARRTTGGSLDFDLPEARVVLNAAGEPTEIQRVLRLGTHRLIEEFMILANTTVAAEAARRRLAFIYRIHESPEPVSLEALREALQPFGLSVGKGAERSPKAFQKLLGEVRDRPEEALVNTLVLRSMKQARYSAKNEAHFALAAPHYAHFTSPIRRYPDLVVHRILTRALLDGERIPEAWAKDVLPAAAQRSSERERLAMEAERDSVELKKIEFLRRHLGDEFWGTISGVAAYGFFVLLDDVFADGLVRAHTLEDDYYHLIETEHALVGEHTGRRFRLGDRVRVRVDRVDPQAREVDLSVTGHEETAPRRRLESGRRPRGRRRIDGRTRRR